MSSSTAHLGFLYAALFVAVSTILAAETACPTVVKAAQGKVALVDDRSRGQLFEAMGEDLESPAPASDVALFAFRAAFRFPHDALWRNPVLNAEPRTGQIFGIDVSHHNVGECHCKLDWAALAQQHIRFAYLKATQGANYYDDQFDNYLHGIRTLLPAKRIEVGAYHFLSADGSAQDQAENFTSVIDGKVGEEDLRPSLDLEWDVRTSGGHVILGANGKAKDFWVGTDSRDILAKTLKWLELVERHTHKTPVVYTNAGWWRERIGPLSGMQAALGRFPVWISDLSSKGLRVEQPYVYQGNWYMWQFTFTATFENGGLPSGSTVDADVFKGDIADLKSKQSP